MGKKKKKCKTNNRSKIKGGKRNKKTRKKRGGYNKPFPSINKIRKEAKEIANNKGFKKMLREQSIIIPTNINKLLDNVTKKDFFNALNLFESNESKQIKGGGNSNNEEEVCPICQEEIGTRRLCGICLPQSNTIPQGMWPYRCGHYNKHCMNCYYQLFNNSPTCPLCRAEMYPVDHARRRVGRCLLPYLRRRGWLPQTFDGWTDLFAGSMFAIIVLGIALNGSGENLFSRGGIDRPWTLFDKLVFILFLYFVSMVLRRQRRADLEYLIGDPTIIGGRKRCKKKTRRKRRRKNKTRKMRGGEKEDDLCELYFEYFGPRDPPLEKEKAIADAYCKNIDLNYTCEWPGHCILPDDVDSDNEEEEPNSDNEEEEKEEEEKEEEEEEEEHMDIHPMPLFRTRRENVTYDPDHEAAHVFGEDVFGEDDGFTSGGGSGQAKLAVKEDWKLGDPPIVGYNYLINIYGPGGEGGEPILLYEDEIGKYMGPASEFQDGFGEIEGQQPLFKTQTLEDVNGFYDDEFIGEIVRLIGPPHINVGGRRKKKTRKKKGGCFGKWCKFPQQHVEEEEEIPAVALTETTNTEDDKLKKIVVDALSLPNGFIYNSKEKSYHINGALKHLKQMTKEFDTWENKEGIIKSLTFISDLKKIVKQLIYKFKAWEKENKRGGKASPFKKNLLANKYKDEYFGPLRFSTKTYRPDGFHLYQQYKYLKKIESKQQQKLNRIGIMKTITEEEDFDIENWLVLGMTNAEIKQNKYNDPTNNGLIVTIDDNQESKYYKGGEELATINGNYYTEKVWKELENIVKNQGIRFDVIFIDGGQYPGSGYDNYYEVDKVMKKGLRVYIEQVLNMALKPNARFIGSNKYIRPKSFENIGEINDPWYSVDSKQRKDGQTFTVYQRNQK